MMKQALQQKTTQQLTLTPQMQQSIRLLQMSTLELQAEIEQYLHDNPLLERADEVIDQDTAASKNPGSTSSTVDEHSTTEENKLDFSDHEDWQPELSWSKTYKDHDASDEEGLLLNIPAEHNLRQLIYTQLSELKLSKDEQTRLCFLVEHLNDDGYLSEPLESLHQLLPEELDISLEELSYLRKLLQNLEPSGIACESLQEFLCLQLNALPHHACQTYAKKIVSQHFEALGNRDTSYLKKQLKLSSENLKKTLQLISSLRPSPAHGMGEAPARYVVPDVLIKEQNGQWIAKINQKSLPKITVNHLYANILQNQCNTKNHLVEKLQEARWLVKNIEQRFDTILKVSEAIVEAQQMFFKQGEIAMRPLILKDIAEQLGLHESTISRITSQKYLLCSRGVFELKYFFGSALHTSTGEDCSATAIKVRIKTLIQNESPNKPLSDQVIATKLAEQGIKIARRTVAKYREMLSILPANQRKSL